MGMCALLTSFHVSRNQNVYLCLWNIFQNRITTQTKDCGPRTDHLVGHSSNAPHFYKTRVKSHPQCELPTFNLLLNTYVSVQFGGAAPGWSSKSWAAGLRSPTSGAHQTAKRLQDHAQDPRRRSPQTIILRRTWYSERLGAGHQFRDHQEDCCWYWD